jgi:uncharacterized membrane protein YcgQ (UPF0703/DUF1980 family)
VSTVGTAFRIKDIDNPLLLLIVNNVVNIHINYQCREGDKMTLEELQAKVLEMEETQKTIQSENETLKKQVEDKIKREKELEEHNQRLWLKITSKVEDKPTETEDKEVKEYIGEKVYNELSDKDKEKLSIILKGDD